MLWACRPFKSRSGWGMDEQSALGWACCSTAAPGSPVAALFDNLEDRSSLAEFVELFPGVTEDQARAVLEQAAPSTAAARA
jgi:hypothetical protein